MTWKAYRLVYRALSPVHIGYHKLGFIQRTRYYITGRNMWGAMTSALVRVGAAFDIKKYHEIGTGCMNKKVIAGYFYPALDPAEPFVPRYGEDGLNYGGMDAPDFERSFIKSFGQTAIDPSINTAEESSLHETEYLAGTIDFKLMFYVGHVFVKMDSDVAKDWDAHNGFEETVKELFVGGERKYGFGRLALKDSSMVKDVFGCAFNGDVERPCITVHVNHPLSAHLCVSNGLKVKGDIEPFVGRSWDAKKGAGQKIESAGVCWTPGSILVEGGELEIKAFGILHSKKGGNG